jgi:hypothetical protein
MNTAQFFKIVQFCKIRSNSKNEKKIETKNGKLRKISPEIKKNRLDQVKSGSKYSRRFPKPKKNKKHAILIGPAH